jgi:hypothetical protein
VALDDIWGWGWTVGDVNDNGDGDDGVGGGHNNNGGRTGTMTADSSHPPAMLQGGNNLRSSARPRPTRCGGPMTMTATMAREARQQR